MPLSAASDPPYSVFMVTWPCTCSRSFTTSIGTQASDPVSWPRFPAAKSAVTSPTPDFFSVERLASTP